MNNDYVLKYYSSGSYGVLVKNISNDIIYKITEFSNYSYISGNNFNEMIYLNYFKNKYSNLYLKSDNNLPIQNISTHIKTLNYFVKQYKIDDELLNIIVNKMKFYSYNLSELKKKDFDSDLDIDNLYLQLEKIILGLHFFHSNGLAHGDLKLINIVSDKNDYKIVDFGGVKYILNPIYECTCTSTYRSPEDYEFEYDNLIQNNMNKLYSGCPIKSDIWSLGIIFNELVNKLNPIQIKYNQFRNYTNVISNDDIEYKIYLYFKKIKQFNLMEKSLIFFNHNDNKLSLYKINKIIEKMLKFNPNERINLNEIYSNLFYHELPDLEKDKINFDYDIKSQDYLEKFINFRKFYYKLIKLNLDLIDELFLYPYIANLFDRFIIILINIYLFESINFNDKFNFIIELINQKNTYELNNDINFDKLIYNMNMCYCSIYLISKLVILKKNINVVKNIINLINFLNTKNESNIKANDIILVYKYIMLILNIMNYDIIRTKLFLYPNTPDELIQKLIMIIENFDIVKIIKYIE